MKLRGLFVLSATTVAACGFAPTNGATSGGDGGSGRASPDAHVDPDGRRQDGTLPVDALPLLPDAQPGSCMARWRSGTVPVFHPVGTLGISFSGSQQRDPALGSDDLTLYYSSDEQLSHQQIWSATRPNLSSGFPVGGVAADFATINDDASDNEKVTFSHDLQDIVLSSDRGSANGLWHAHNTDGTYGAPDQTGMEAINVAGQSLADPQLAGNDLHLYYVTDVGGAQHIVMATRETVSSAWSAGVAYASLNSGQGDADPTVSEDESTIVFSSQRAGGAGLTDLYYATRDSAGGEFGPVHALASINTANHEGDPQLSHNGCAIFFATDNGEEANDYDLWFANMDLTQ